MINFRNVCRIGKTLFLNKVLSPQGNETFRQTNYTKNMKPVNVQDFFNKLGINHRSAPNGFRIKQCLFCTKPHYNDQTNLFTLIVNKQGLYYCHRCASKGNWSQLKAKYLNTEATDISTLMSEQGSIGNGEQMPVSQIEYFFYLSNMKKPEYQQALNYLKQSGLTQQTIQKYLVGAGVETFFIQTGKPMQIKCLHFPFFQFASKNKKKGQQKPGDKLQTSIVKYKVKGLPPHAKHFRFHPLAAKSGFFGLNTVTSTDKVIVITEGQLNAMAVNQQTGYPAISLPQGASSLNDQCLPFLDQFEKIVLWFDNDQSGRLGEDKICYKVGSSRTYIVRHDIPELKNAIDFLKHAPQKMKSLIEKSKTKPGQNILSFADIEQSVKNRIFRHEQYVGVKVDWLPFFNKKVKGIRMQELSVVSGPTGCGKTTFLSQVTLDLCKKQIPVLWGSFQIKNEVLITNMIIQFSGLNLFQQKQKFEYYSEQFKNLPLYWLSFHGSNDVEKVMAAIEYSIQKHNISLVILDTLQFLLSQQAQGYKKFDLQDKVMSRLRKIATDHNVHIVIVIHPRKTEDNQDIQIHSIYGTSKATQEADNVWMLQSRDNFRVFDIKKNRFDGDVGKVAIGYNKHSKSFFQLKKSELSSIFNNESTIDKIVQKRQQQNQQQNQNIQQKQIQIEKQENVSKDLLATSLNRTKKST